MTQEHTTHALHSSNLPFHSTLWDAAKTTKGLVAITRRFFWEPGLKRTEKKSGQRRKQSALVDIVAEGGKQWIKVSTVTESRLLFDLAKAGWECHSEASCSDDETMLVNGLRKTTANPAPAPDVEEEVEIVRLAQDLHRAAQATYVDYDHPKVVFLLPRLPSDGCASEVSRVLAKVATIAEVRYGPIRPPNLTLPEIFQRMVFCDTATLTPTLNIDCTILLALVSDLSHCSASNLLQRPDAPQYHPLIKRQIAGEDKESLLPRVLYPILDNRRLTCTREAAKRMRNIVNTMGTATEAARTEIFMGLETSTDRSPVECNKRRLSLDPLGMLSIHPTPLLHLPIEVLNNDISTLLRRLPSAAAEVAPSLSALNKSVFLYGWAENLTTITSNRVVASELEQMIIAIKKKGAQEQLHLKGPRLWVCNTARSLVGKEKGRKVG